MKRIDLTGKKFGRLIVIERAKSCLEKNKRKRIRWKCKCECGKEIITKAYHLTCGKTKSCGCIKEEILKKGIKPKFTEEQKTISILNRRKQQRNYLLNKLFGITRGRYDEMVSNQKNRCLICNENMKKPHVDHNHDTGKVRGLLCFSCNMLLGMAKEKSEILQSAIKYLKTYNG